jgi:hypothetical protein
MANGQNPALRVAGNIAGAVVASNLAAALIAKEKKVDAADAVRIYQEVVEEMRKRSAPEAPSEG